MNETENQYTPLKNKYIIGGLKTGMILRGGGIIEKQARDYICDFEGYPEIVIGLDDEYVLKKHKEYPHLSLLECEYMWTGAHFCEKLLEFDGFMLHASAVSYKDGAYLFSAPSGTGKSTHTALWRKVFGEDEVYIINDDKPIIRITDGEPIVYGTPWSGKTDQNRNVGVKLKGICFLERSEDNWIKRLETADALYGILNQTLRPWEGDKMGKLLELLDKLLTQTAVYRMGCNISEDAVYTAYNGMNG